jgi:lipid-binding SYLF domain-containing protein
MSSFVFPLDPGQGMDKMIPANILENAQGLAIYSVLKAGFLFSGRMGGGLVVARYVIMVVLILVEP